MPRFELTGPDGGKYELEAPDENAALSAFNQLHGGAASPPAAAPAPPAFDPNDQRYSPHAQASAAALRGVPLLGAGVEKAGAAISAAAHPLTGVGSDASSFADRYVKNLESEEAAKTAYETKHPIKSAVEGGLGGALALGGFGSLVPAAGRWLGMSGKLVPAATRATISGAGIGGADAALRGRDPVAGSEIGALTGAGGVVAGKAIGKVWDAARGAFRPAAPPVPTRTMPVAGVEVPVPESVVTGNAAASELEQSALHGGQGVRAQEVARGHRALTDEAMGRAHADFEAGLDPTGARPAASPMAAGEAIGTEVSAQEAARAAAESARLQAVTTEGGAIRADLNTSPTPGVLADTPVTAAQGVREALIGARDRLAARRDAAYDVLRGTKGEFDAAELQRSAPRIRSQLSAGADPVNVSDMLTPQTSAALRDMETNLGRPVRSVPEEGRPASPRDQDVADIRAKFGDDVAAAYERQNAPAPAEQPEGPKTQSLLEFLASKGGLGPDAELNAIGGQGHTVNIEGIGRRKLVRQGGWPLDYAREAAEEAGYLRGTHKGTSTVNDLLDAIDAEIRGQKRFPEGFEGHVGKRDARVRSERDQHEYDAHIRGLEDDLAAAGHGSMAPDVKQRAVKLMADEHIGADEAVDRALRQLEHEDAAGLHKAASDFPGDRAPAPAPGEPITADTIDVARKRLVSMQRAASSTARRTGDYSDVRGMRRVIAEFEREVERVARAPGGFSGDAQELLDRLSGARGLHAELKRTFGPQNPQDDVGKAIEKIVGKRDVAPAELETIAPLLFGSTQAGGQVQGRVAQRVIDIFGRDSAQVAQLKQGLISHILDTPAGMEPLSHAKAADKIHQFFSGTRGVGLAQTLFSPSERARLLAHANQMRAAHDPIPANQVEKTVAKWAGRDGGLRASPKQIVDDLMGSTGSKGTAPALVEHLQRRLSPDAISTLKQGVWSRITEGADGTIPWKDQKVGQRLMNFLNGDGKGLADALFTPAELKAMREIGEAHIKLLPVEGTTNPSRSGHVIERMMRGMAHSLLPFLGFHAGGLPGAAAALGAKATVSKIVDRRAAGKAVERFYGPQPPRVSAPSMLPQSFGALGGPIAAEQRQSR